jgi:peptide/nickel transport system substrate-binding protein
VLRVGLPEEPTSLDPGKALTLEDLTVMGQVVEPLFVFTSANKLEPRLVTKTEKSPDLRRWKFTLRPGVKFSNGQPMTAADVVFSINLTKTNPYYGSILEELKTVHALSPSEVEIRTSKPFPAMEADLSLVVTGIVPKNLAGESSAEFGTHPIGTGPFAMKSWTRGGAVSLVPNPHYWEAGKPFLDELDFSAVPSEPSRLKQLEAGELDLIYGPEASPALRVAESKPGITVGTYQESAVQTLLLNPSSPLFADARAREAVNLALDRSAVVKAAQGEFGGPAGTFLPEGVLYSDPALKNPSPNAEKAKALLAEAVKETGASPSIEFMVETNSTFQSLASQIIQSNLEEVGFNVKIKQVDSATFLELQDAGEFNLELTLYTSGSPDPSELTGYWGGVFEDIGADTDRYNKLAAEASTEANAERREHLYREIQELVLKENVLMTLTTSPAVWTGKEGVAGLNVNALDFPFLMNTGFAP